ncbi:mucin-2-like [Eurosta solidaginis]|uniref:mucin-2-like n=1 Tax=Eurosta solidaginis TaxID=178769 RepID=UPI003530D67B
MIFGINFCSCILLTFVALPACHTHELQQIGVQGSYAAILPSKTPPQYAAASAESAALQHDAASLLPPTLQLLAPSAPRCITVIARNGTRSSYFTVASALNALTPLNPATCFNVIENPAPTSIPPNYSATLPATLDSIRRVSAQTANTYYALPVVPTNPADANQAATPPPTQENDIQFKVLYRPRPIPKQPQAYARSVPSNTYKQIRSTTPSATPSQPASKNISSPEKTTPLPLPYQPSWSAISIEAAQPSNPDLLVKPISSAEIKELARQTIKNPKQIWKYLKYRFKSRHPTTKKPLDDTIARGYAVLSIPKTCTPATLFKKAKSMPFKHTQTDLYTDDVESGLETPYRAEESGGQSGSDEKIIT